MPPQCKTCCCQQDYPSQSSLNTPSILSPWLYPGFPSYVFLYHVQGTDPSWPSSVAISQISLMSSSSASSSSLLSDLWKLSYLTLSHLRMVNVTPAVKSSWRQSLIFDINTDLYLLLLTAFSWTPKGSTTCLCSLLPLLQSQSGSGPCSAIFFEVCAATAVRMLKPRHYSVPDGNAAMQPNTGTNKIPKSIKIKFKFSVILGWMGPFLPVL